MSLVLSPAGRRYGFKQSPPDHRDFGILTVPMPETRLGRPSSVILENWCGPVFDQGQQGSCTANAGCGNGEYLLRRFKSDDTILSRSFLYYLERQIDGTLDEGDCGSTGRSSCIVMNKFGMLPDSGMPYRDSDFNTAPTAEQLSEALNKKSGAYHVLGSVSDMISCVASQFPVIIGFGVFESFENGWAQSGYMPIPSSSEQLLGGHEVLVIGYDDDKQAFLVRNSWGSGWQLGGNFWFPYKAAANPDILWEARIQHLGPAWR